MARIAAEGGRAMMLCIPEVLTRAELERLRTALAGAEFADGKATTGYRARRVKNNLQLARDNAVGKEIAPLIEQALWRSETFGWAVWPKQIRGILFSRYEPGMGYGNHVDNAIMGKASLWRSDVAFTIFLADPTDYDGGELVIESALGAQEVKLAAGEAVVYPASSVHRVAQVTRGQRLAAIGWVQSQVRDPAQREILYDLERIKRLLAERLPEAPETDWAFKTQANLLRMWADP
jgi:PKHD-type hydroxylase